MREDQSSISMAVVAYVSCIFVPKITGTGVLDVSETEGIRVRIDVKTSRSTS